MSIIGVILLGDRTSHGGVVLSADPSFIVNGRPVARVGDTVFCPRCNRATTILTSRFPSVIDDGKPVAFDKDMTDCGSIIYSSVNDDTGWGNMDAPNVPAVAEIPVEEWTAPKQLDFREHFILKNNETGQPLSGVPYKIRIEDGTVIEGETDDQGRTDVVWTDSPKAIEVIIDPEPDSDDDPYHYDDNIEYIGL